MADQEKVGRDLEPKVKRQSKPKPRKFFSISPDFVRGAAPGFELENEDKLRNGRTALEHVPWRPGFPEFPETPRFLFDKRLGRPVRDLEQYGHYWLVSDRAKQVLEIIDPEGVVFLKCDVHSRDGEPGPTYWFCGVLRLLDIVDDDASTVKTDYP